MQMQGRRGVVARARPLQVLQVLEGLQVLKVLQVLLPALAVRPRLAAAHLALVVVVAP